MYKLNRILDSKNMTMLGIIFGVGAVISMLSIGEGAKQQALEQIQLMFVDSSGDWAIVEGDNILRKKGNSPFQVITNFYHSELKKKDEIPCQRYKSANEMFCKYHQQNDTRGS